MLILKVNKISNEILYETLNIISEEQLLVLNIIQEYLNKNRTFNKIEIVPFINAKIAKKKINISYNGIYEILKSLVEKNIIVEGSKLIKYDIFSNVNRKKIYEFITKNPGVHFNKLVKSLNISVFSVEWHLNILLKFDLIRKVKIEKYEAYFDSKLDSKNDEILHIISREKCKRIIQYLKQNNEGYSKNYLSNELNIHSNTISKYIEKLEEFGLLLKKELSNMTLYFLNEDHFADLSCEIKTLQ
ncbi:MAG: HTH domain-containing protein [Promethearchaeota archaeon]|nr:MAG: HTH domain-containing protein [Candidatus Lokiarchaeota archaeon]